MRRKEHLGAATGRGKATVIGQEGIFLSCPLFEHQKHTSVCTVLRAKRVCRANCIQYFNWSKTHIVQIEADLAKHGGMIQKHLHPAGGSRSDLLVNVLPSGEHLCAHCGKAFKHEKKLLAHNKKKHRRQQQHQ